MRYLLSILLLFALLRASSQQLILTGRVRCLNSGVINSTRGAANLVVFPALLPQSSTITDPAPAAGFYEVDTGVDFKLLEDKKLRFYILYGRDRSEASVFHQYISRDLLDINRTSAQRFVITIKDFELKANCDSADMGPLKPLALIDSLNLTENVTQFPDRKLWAAPGVLQLLVTILQAADPPKEDSVVAERVPLEHITPSSIESGRLLFNSLMPISGNMGFNIVPNRNKSEMVFWNPSGTALRTEKYAFGVLTNYRNNFRASASTRLSRRTSIGMGFIVAGQNQFRTIVHQGEEFEEKTKVIEHAFLGTFAYNLNRRISIGVGIKSSHQRFNIASMILETRYYRDGLLRLTEYDPVSEVVKIQRTDFDISATWWAVGNFGVGFNIINVRNTKLISSLNTAYDTPEWIGQRMYCAGFNYLNRRFNIGSDLVLWNNQLHVSSGLSFVPINNSEIILGWSSHKDEYSITLRYGKARLTYVEYRDNQVNEGDRFVFKTPKIFGGFEWSF